MADGVWVGNLPRGTSKHLLLSELAAHGGPPPASVMVRHRGVVSEDRGSMVHEYSQRRIIYSHTGNTRERNIERERERERERDREKARER